MKVWKKIKYYLQHVDSPWSFTLIVLAFYLFGLLLQWMFGYGTGVYDPAFFQPAILAVGIVIIASNAAIGGLFFTFRGLYRYIFGQKDESGNFINYSKEDWLKLSIWQRYLVAFGVFFCFFAAVIVVYLKLV